MWRDETCQYLYSFMKKYVQLMAQWRWEKNEENKKKADFYRKKVEGERERERERERESEKDMREVRKEKKKTMKREKKRFEKKERKNK